MPYEPSSSPSPHSPRTYCSCSSHCGSPTGQDTSNRSLGGEERREGGREEGGRKEEGREAGRREGGRES